MSVLDKAERERQAILAAIDRVLAGTTRYAEPGALTQTAVAQEAQLHRSRLVNIHTDLRDLFEARKAAQFSISASERKLRAKLVDLEAKNATLRSERDSWKETATVFARAIQVLQTQLRHHSGGTPPNVTKLPDRR